MDTQEQAKDFLLKDANGTYAGKHLLIEVCDAKNLDDAMGIKQMLVDCALAAGATVLHTHTHVFTPSGGVSGVAILAESHISIHSWPEIGYAAMDVFMCGDTQPEAAVDIIKAMFATDKVVVKLHKRGQGLLGF